MLKGKLVFAQVTAFLPRSVFDACVAKYGNRYAPLSFSYWDQLLCMVFAQLTSRASLRDLTTCLRSHSNKLHFAGFRGPIARSTISDANERRDSRIFEEFARHLMGIARPLYARDALGSHIARSIYAIDASLIDLCATLCPWAPAPKGKAGIKLHAQLDLRGNIPSVVRITTALTADQAFLDHVLLEAGSFYVMDRAYLHFARLATLNDAGAFFVVRGKARIEYELVANNAVDVAAGVMLDQRVRLTGRYTRHSYPSHIRRIEYKDAESGRVFAFFTNNFDLEATAVAGLYRSRWQVELFFKLIKQHLRIRSFIGTTANAVRIQVWTAISTYLLIAIIKKQLQVPASMHTILQILSVNLFEKVPLEDLLSEATMYEESESHEGQLTLL